MGTQEMLRVVVRETRGNFPGDESRSKLPQTAKTIENWAT